MRRKSEPKKEDELLTIEALAVSFIQLLKKELEREICDRCNSKALVAFVKEKASLIFCGHHGNKMALDVNRNSHLASHAGWSIAVDNREWKAEERYSEDSATAGSAGRLDGSGSGVAVGEETPGWDAGGEEDPTPIGA